MDDLDRSGGIAVMREGARLLALTRLGNADLAEEVAQETVARVLAALASDQVRDLARLPAFARAVAHHVIADVQRRDYREQSLAVTPELPDGRIAPPLESVVAAERREELRRALAQLPPADRNLLRLVYFEGLSAPELARRLGERADRIRKRKQRALDRLRGALGRGGHDSPDPATVGGPVAPSGSTTRKAR